MREIPGGLRGGALQGHQLKSRFPKSLTPTINLRGKFAIKYRARSHWGASCDVESTGVDEQESYRNT
jgi:hypothetical protein